MKLSDYILALQEIIETNGDMDCVAYVEGADYKSTGQDSWESVDKYDMLNSIITKVDRVISYKTKGGNKEFCSINMKGYVDGEMEKVFVIEDRY